jgi:hypothetical protein
MQKEKLIMKMTAMLRKVSKLKINISMCWLTNALKIIFQKENKVNSESQSVECLWVGKNDSCSVEVTSQNTFYGFPPFCDIESNTSLNVNYLVESDNKTIATVVVYKPSRIIAIKGGNK